MNVFQRSCNQWNGSATLHIWSVNIWHFRGSWAVTVTWSGLGWNVLAGFETNNPSGFPHFFSPPQQSFVFRLKWLQMGFIRGSRAEKGPRASAGGQRREERSKISSYELIINSLLFLFLIAFYDKLTLVAAPIFQTIMTENDLFLYV